MINLNTKRNRIFGIYPDGSFSEREYFLDSLIRMKVVKGYYTSVTIVAHGVSVIAIKDARKDARKEIDRYNIVL